jgi:hypothetical protein
MNCEGPVVGYLPCDDPTCTRCNPPHLHRAPQELIDARAENADMAALLARLREVVLIAEARDIDLATGECVPTYWALYVQGADAFATVPMPDEQTALAVRDALMRMLKSYLPEEADHAAVHG